MSITLHKHVKGELAVTEATANRKDFLWALNLFVH